MAAESYSGNSCAIADTVVTEPASPTSVRASRSGTVSSARSSAASMSARIAATCASVGGSVTAPSRTRCRSVSRTQPTSTERAARVVVPDDELGRAAADVDDQVGLVEVVAARQLPWWRR